MNDLDRALAILIEAIRARAWSDDAAVMRHAVEILILMRERIASLAEQNKALREIVAKHLGKPLPAGDRPRRAARDLALEEKP